MPKINTNEDAHPNKEMQEIMNLILKMRKNLLNVKRTWGSESPQYSDAVQAMQEFMQEKDGLYERIDRMLEKKRRLKKDASEESHEDVDKRQTLTERSLEQLLADLKLK
ncbi:uncharacterized protein PV06_10941 [Exophiala oligosperma]|uniref:Uncharacterized protein n=2 Tax=Chaetothyriales TaxID=34395 RepID=A0A0D2DM50_9EURO|nr:uncharacterized protein PV06_10941 [Exophiala oligosperma]KAJ9635058.1 hypothetical protein H2204_006013 [Knufia peltigerae]KIW36819.1 hypothetical protein PV06_10941 [Exophiala oligosperma]